MATNVSFDGSPVQFRMDSPLLACFDPLALDMLRELLPAGRPLDVDELLERANVHHPALACYAISNFHPGLFTLDPQKTASIIVMAIKRQGNLRAKRLLFNLRLLIRARSSLQMLATYLGSLIC